MVEVRTARRLRRSTWISGRSLRTSEVSQRWAEHRQIRERSGPSGRTSPGFSRSCGRKNYSVAGRSPPPVRSRFPRERRADVDAHSRGFEGWTVNLRKHELIGLRVEVIGASDPSQAHLEGRVVDETRNMLIVDGRGAEKRIPKHASRFRFAVPGGFEIDGDEIRYRPEDRVKKAR